MTTKRLLCLFLTFLLVTASVFPTTIHAENENTGAASGASNESTQASEPAASTPSENGIPDDAQPSASPLVQTSALDLDANAALLIELNSGTVIYDKNADAKIFPASLTKIMTAIVAIEKGTLSDQVTVSAEALQNLHIDGSSASLKEGEILTFHDLLYCIMIESANDACPVVAEHLVGSEAAFVDLMNQKAQELGCKGTHFANTHGLHEDDHYTTARDLALIASYAMKNEVFREIATTYSYTVPATNLSQPRYLTTTNYLVNTAITSDYYYSKAIGIKTGYTSKAGRCLITSARQGDLNLLAVICGASTTQDEAGNTIFGNFISGKKLLSFGLNNFVFVNVLSSLAPIAQVPVTQAAGAASVVITPSEDVRALLPDDFDKTQLDISYKLDKADGLEAPLEAGQKVGTVTVSYGGRVIGTTAVKTVTAVERSVIAYSANQTAKYISGNLPKILLIVVLLLVLLLLLWIRIVYILRKNRRKRNAQRRNHKP